MVPRHDAKSAYCARCDDAFAIAVHALKPIGHLTRPRKPSLVPKWLHMLRRNRIEQLGRPPVASARMAGAQITCSRIWKQCVAATGKATAVRGRQVRKFTVPRPMLDNDFSCHTAGPSLGYKSQFPFRCAAGACRPTTMRLFKRRDMRELNERARATGRHLHSRSFGRMLRSARPLWTQEKRHWLSPNARVWRLRQSTLRCARYACACC